MCLLVESIKIVDGIPMNLEYHNARMNASRGALFSDASRIELEKEIEVPASYRSGLVKCRVEYRTRIERIEFESFEFWNVKSLKLVCDDSIEYSHKFLDRSSITALYALRGNADDILIVKNGLITDTSRANVALFDGERWHTPARPLLRGTKRQKLIDSGQLIETEIAPRDLRSYKTISCINAMRELGEISIDISSISI
jgi:4-amino-4-deoxychorismate lyase